LTVRLGVEGLRPVRDDDADALRRLIGGVYAEYPGCVLEPDGLDADLDGMASLVARKGGEFWVVERDGAVVACCGWGPAGDGVVELKRLYVGPAARRQGIGRRLVEMVEQAARNRRASAVELWSDTRFGDAHRLYESLGYRRLPDSRDLNDASNSTEYHFRKQL
jgi:putative acetyltransferase